MTEYYQTFEGQLIDIQSPKHLLGLQAAHPQGRYLGADASARVSAVKANDAGFAYPVMPGSSAHGQFLAAVVGAPVPGSTAGNAPFTAADVGMARVATGVMPSSNGGASSGYGGGAAGGGAASGSVSPLFLVAVGILVFMLVRRA